MLRFLSATITVLALALSALTLSTPALSAAAQDAEVGKDYEITIETEEDNQYVGAYGQVRIGATVVNVPNAKVAEKYHIKITAISQNQYSGNMQASCEFELIDGDRKGMSLPAP